MRRGYFHWCIFLDHTPKEQQLETSIYNVLYFIDLFLNFWPWRNGHIFSCGSQGLSVRPNLYLPQLHSRYHTLSFNDWCVISAFQKILLLCDYLWPIICNLNGYSNSDRPLWRNNPLKNRKLGGTTIRNKKKMLLSTFTRDKNQKIPNRRNQTPLGCGRGPCIFPSPAQQTDHFHSIRPRNAWTGKTCCSLLAISPSIRSHLSPQEPQSHWRSILPACWRSPKKQEIITIPNVPLLFGEGTFRFH